MTIQASPLNRERNGHRHLIAADTGGTFTDLAVYDAETGATRFGKALTTGDLVEGVFAGLEDTGANVGQASLFKHGTTHVINAFISETRCTDSSRDDNRLSRRAGDRSR